MELCEGDVALRGAGRNTRDTEGKLIKIVRKDAKTVTVKVSDGVPRKRPSSVFL